MARAQRLTEQVKTMAARIKQLETALANAENGPLALAALDDEQGSLQDCEPDAVEYEGELDRVSKFMGSLAITSEGQGHYYGATAGPEVRASFLDLSPSYSYLFFTVSATSHARSLSPLLGIAQCILSRLSGRRSKQAPRARSKIQST